jgi:Asp-tRNA(Asn)/Glu-tRNA(Gln) amidotransferase A subunit family amidase
MTTPVARPYLTATAGFASGSDTPRDFLERCLATIEERDGEIGAFVALNVAGAREVADRSTERWRSGRQLSPIDGMPVGIKDIIETADMPTQMGSPLYEGWRSGRDAASVAALREAGAVVLGKTVTTEFAATEPRGTRNPWDPTRTPGGSSSGSAASVAAGMVPAALGTQVIGSILRPASYCGCVGYKPSVGGINRGGSHDNFSQSCDGVLAATSAEAWTVAREIAARAGGDPGWVGVIGPAVPLSRRPTTLALLETEAWERRSDEAARALDAAIGRLRDAGVAILTRATDATLGAVEAALATASEVSLGINRWEARWPLNTYRERDASKLSRGMIERLAAAEAMTQADYAELLRRRAEARALWAGLASSCDAVVTLSAPGPAPLGLQSTGDPGFAVSASLLGVPAVSLPLLQADNLPLGLQIIGFEQRDADLFGTVAGIETLFA